MLITLPTISSSSAATTHSILLSFIQALGFGVHRPHATLPGPSPSSLGPCTSRRHRRFLQRLYFRVHLAAHFVWSPSFSVRYLSESYSSFSDFSPHCYAADSASSCAWPYYLSSRFAICTHNNTTSEDRYYVGVPNKDESFETEVMLIAPPLNTYPLEKSEAAAVAVVMERNSDENDGNTDM
ncbi:hypothetical protein C8J57DRAFT_1718460 [Mycena rebaudengoi]|nr:hypothetical protein C8J57DRAFT_1718460 [Mycena rebaudengoi]